MLSGLVGVPVCWKVWEEQKDKELGVGGHWLAAGEYGIWLGGSRYLVGMYVDT